MKIDWGAARSDYVNHANLTYAAIARKYKAHKVTIQKRATRENWIAERAQKAALLLQKVTEKTVLNTAEELAKYNEQDLIAAKSLRALAAKRMQRANEGVALEPKDVRALAATIESAQRIARLALGAATQVNDVTLNEADKLTQEERLERIRQLHKQLFPDDEKIH